MRVERALEKLRALLERRGLTSTGAVVGMLLANEGSLAAPAGLAATLTTTALAGVAEGGVATVVTIINFMSTTKMGVCVAATVALLAVGVAVYEGRIATQSIAALTAAGKERDELRAQLAAAEGRARRPEPGIGATASLPNTAESSQAPKSGSVPVSAWQGPIDYVLDHPEKRSAFTEQERQRAKRRYERFFKTARLSPQEQKVFLQHVVTDAEARLDLYAATRAQGYGFHNAPQDPALYQQFYNLHQQVRAELWSNMRTLLGDSRIEQYAQFSLAIPDRNTVEQLAGRLYDTDTPLTARQADEVMALLRRFPIITNKALGPPGSVEKEINRMNGTSVAPAAVEGSMAQAMIQGAMTKLEWHAPVSDLAIARAQAVLTPPQLDALRQLQAQQLTQIQLAPPPPVKTPEIPQAGPKKNG